MELTAFDVSNIVKELQFLVNGKIDNIYQTDEKNLYLQIYIKDMLKQLLRIMAGKAFFLAKERPNFPENLQRFCSYLRKYLINSKIRSLEQVDYERILKITLETREGMYEIYAEFFGKGNIIFSKDKKILAVAEEQIWAERTLKQGELYAYPERKDAKEIFEKYKAKGKNTRIDEIEKQFPIQKDNSLIKNKEIRRITTIIQKQTENLEIAEKEAEENRKKGELIYENYQKLKEMTEKAKMLKEKHLAVELE